MMRHRVFLLLFAISVMALTLGCSVGRLIVKENTPTPPPTKTPRPTFTPTPPATATPLPTNTPLPTSTPTFTPLPTNTATVTATPLPTDTPTPAFTDTPSPMPVPLAVTNADNVNFRAGPSTSYGSLGKLPEGTRLEVRGRLADSSWMRVCCWQGQEGWVAAQFLQLNVPVDSVAVDTSVPPTPTRAPTFTRVPPTNTPVPAPSYRFALQSKEDFATTNEFLDIGVRITNGQTDNFLPGFRIKVIDTTNGREFLSKVSTTSWYWTDFPGSGAAKKANVNFDPIPVYGTINWVIYVTDDAGNRLSADVTFTTSSTSRRKFYFVFVGS